MAYFSQGDGRKKLMLLYFLQQVDLALTRNQLYTIFAEQNWMDYFDFQSNLAELCEDAFVAVVPFSMGEGYRITQYGEETLRLFQGELPHSVLEKLSSYALQNRALLVSKAQFSSTQTQLPDGGALAVLRLMDKTSHILDITLQLPNAQLANEACAQWPAEAEALYQEIIRRLFPNG